jgi:formamidopyrimidine-DNA glycosylase
LPELPEVETVVRGLRNVLPGRRIVEVRLGKTDFIEDPAALGRHLPGQQIASVHRMGKFIVLDLTGTNGDAQEFTLLIHLGMTGQIVTCAAAAPVVPHTHVFFALDDGREMRYTDIRRFGQMRILTDAAREKALGQLGIDPLEGSRAEFIKSIGGRRRHVKALLLDQHVMRGMGNIYTDESLFRARIHPKRLGTNLSIDELRKLYKSVQDVLTEAIKLRGSSISDYVDSEGRRGEFQLRHRVYQREGKKCLRCGTPIRRAIVAGRSSYFCPICQRAPRIRSRGVGKRKRA